jgi:hypothetical protein
LNRRRVTLWAWLMLFPNCGFLPQISQAQAIGELPSRRLARRGRRQTAGFYAPDPAWSMQAPGAQLPPRPGEPIFAGRVDRPVVALASGRGEAPFRTVKRANGRRDARPPREMPRVRSRITRTDGTDSRVFSRVRFCPFLA